MSESDAGDAGFVRLHIVSPEEVLFDGRVSWAQVPLEDGMIGIWPGHGALVAALGSGEVEYLVGGDVLRLGIGSGVLRISDERCVVMVSRLLGEDDEGDAAGGLCTTPCLMNSKRCWKSPGPMTRPTGKQRVSRCSPASNSPCG